MDQTKKSDRKTRSARPHASPNAFGPSSPHCNLPFPVGRLTAAEILAYCPHWLKSIDVVDRFITNGGKPMIIASMLNQIRVLPEKTIPINSVCIMMQGQMRSAGFEGWTMGKHESTTKTRVAEWDVNDLDVTTFRAPYETHPKKGTKQIENVPAKPKEFRDLADNVDKHPTGADALDLTRCVQHALDHPSESWLFPVDFERLVNKLGGPMTVTHSNTDTEAFARHVSNFFSKKVKVAPLAKRLSFADTDSKGSTDKADMRLPLPEKDDEVIAAPKRKRGLGEDSVAPAKKQKRGKGEVTAAPTKKRGHEEVGGDYGPPQKKHRASSEGVFVADYTSDSETLLDFLVERSSSTPTSPIEALLRGPLFAVPPLDGPQEVIDENNVCDYAEDGCTTVEQMLRSAFSPTRFNGPRLVAPFRELWTINDPLGSDISEWAENIRWAKEQHLNFDAGTWTEHRDHLDQIAAFRKVTMWTSVEAIVAGW